MCLLFFIATRPPNHVNLRCYILCIQWQWLSKIQWVWQHNAKSKKDKLYSLVWKLHTSLSSDRLYTSLFFLPICDSFILQPYSKARTMEWQASLWQREKHISRQAGTWQNYCYWYFSKLHLVKTSCGTWTGTRLSSGATASSPVLKNPSEETLVGGQAKYLIGTRACAGHFSIFADQYEITGSQASDCVLLSARWVSTKSDDVTVLTLQAVRLCIVPHKRLVGLLLVPSYSSTAPDEESASSAERLLSCSSNSSTSSATAAFNLSKSSLLSSAILNLWSSCVALK